MEYLVKWLGWADSYNEWLPLHDLHCPDLIADYEKKAKSTV